MSLQDPEFDKFKRAFKEENFEAALHSLRKLIAQYPQSFSLRWHHARVLEKLARFAEARTVVNKVLELRSDFVPALIMQVQLDFHENEHGTGDELEDDPAQQQQARFDAIEERLYKILSIDPNAVDALHMLSGLLRGHEGDTHLAKADQLLDRAIHLAPERVDLLEDRGNSFLANAIDPEDDNTDHQNAADLVITSSGMRYSRDVLEQALADFQKCYDLSHQHRYGLRVGSILHDLGRFDEALATYDNVLAHVPEDDPYRPLIVERRTRQLLLRNSSTISS
jgi:tetratricopeptide (TPR) repeat protein